MTGEQIGADEALRIGLAHEACASLDAGLARASALAQLTATKSPTAIAQFKRGVLDAVGTPPAVRREREARAYEACVDCGDAAIGRSHFAEIRAGSDVPWNPRSKD